MSGSVPTLADGLVHGGVAEVKLTARCDQRCVFCKSPADAANLVPADALGEVLPVIAGRARLLTLSGGEATLEPALDRVVAQARAAGFHRVELQTNGMSLAERDRVRSLRRAGLTNALISLHAHTPDLSDALTGTPGGFERTLRGIERSLDAGVQVAVCHVICEGNHRELERFAGFVRDRFQGRALQVVFTLAIPTYRVRDAPGLMPRLSALAPGLRRALERFHPANLPPSARLGALGRGLGLARRALEERGERGRWLATRLTRLATPPEGWRRGHRARVIAHCGLPVCVLGSAAPYHDEWWWTEPAPAVAEMVHPADCEDCAHRRRCSGLWRVYVERFGGDGVRPLGVAAERAGPAKRARCS